MAPRSSVDSVSKVAWAEEPAKKGFINTRSGETLRYTKEDVMRHVGKYAKASNKQAAFELFITVVPWLYMFRLSWWWFPLHCLITMRLFVVCVHDPGHGALFSNQTLNTVVCVLSGPLVFMPGLFWRYGHGYHHEHSNDLDFDQASQTAAPTVLDYFTYSPLYRSLYRYFTRPIVMLTQTAPINMVLLQMFKAGTAVEWAVQIAVLAIDIHCGTLLKHVAMIALTMGFGVLVFHLQHTFEGARRAHGFSHFEAGYFGSTFWQPPFFLRPFIGAIEVHHIHHLNAKVPFYRLYECHHAAPPGMWDGIRTITLTEGWDSLRFVLWDHVRDRLISMDELDAAIKQYGDDGYKAMQQAARAEQVKRREARDAATDEEERGRAAKRREAARLLAQAAGQRAD